MSIVGPEALKNKNCMSLSNQTGLIEETKIEGRKSLDWIKFLKNGLQQFPESFSWKTIYPTSNYKCC